VTSSTVQRYIGPSAVSDLISPQPIIAT
jgi:hypothetical protein